MKAEALILLLIVVLFISAFASISVAEPTVDVAVYFESANISEEEKANILNALDVVNGRFVEQLGIGLNFEVVGSWESDKNTESDTVLLEEAIRETDGIWTRVVDNMGWFDWKFYHPPHVVAVYFIDQNMKGEDRDVAGMADIWVRACIVRYFENADKLTAVIQHELSHLFGILEHCDEEWCVMNYAYMPYRFYFLIIVIYEDYAEEWGPKCKQRLIDCYNGLTITYTTTIMFRVHETHYEWAYFRWSTSFDEWNLTSNRLVQFVHVLYNVNIRNSVHAVIAFTCSFK